MEKPGLGVRKLNFVLYNEPFVDPYMAGSRFRDEYQGQGSGRDMEREPRRPAPARRYILFLFFWGGRGGGGGGGGKESLLSMPRQTDILLICGNYCSHCIHVYDRIGE